jgi:hypothetical protein
MDPGPKAARSESMRGESWEGRVDEISKHMAGVLGGTSARRDARRRT